MMNIDEQEERRQEVGRFGFLAVGTLSPNYPTITILIPTYNRFFERSNPDKPGSFVYALSSLLTANEQENAGARFLIVDDTLDERDTGITQALRQACKGISEVPEICLFGRKERQALYSMLDQCFPHSIDREIVHFVCTEGGYGPQRVRGDLLSLGSHYLLSFDDDLRLNGLQRVRSEWLTHRGLSPEENSFVYVHNSLAADPSVVETVATPYLRPYIDMLGKSPEELLHAKMPVALAGLTINEKDCALQALLDGSEVVQFRQTYDRQKPLTASQKAKRVAIASARVQGVPDINAALLLDYTIHHPLDEAIQIKAVVSGPLKPYVVVQDTNPTCGLMGRDFTTSVIHLPWLLSNHRLLEKYERVKGPYRAEDRLYTNPPDDILMANVAVVMTHTRCVDGRRVSNPPENFWSEAIGDAFGDEVKKRLRKDPRTGSYLLSKSEGRCIVAPERAKAMFEKVKEKIQMCQVRRRELEHLSDDEAASKLMQIKEALHTQVSEGFDAFYRSLNSEITEQLDFVRRFFSTYPDLMGGCDEIVKSGKMPIRRFTRDKGPGLFSLIKGLPQRGCVT